MIKWYCLFYFRISFFKKYLFVKNGIEYDIKFIKKNLNIQSLSRFIYKFSNQTQLFKLNRNLLNKSESTIILTAAMEDLVYEILILNKTNIEKENIYGSSLNRTIDGYRKKEIVKKIRKENPKKTLIFFTDSWDDQPVFDQVDRVVFSEYLDEKCKNLMGTNSKYSMLT